MTFHDDACFEPHDRAKMYTIAIKPRCGMQGLRGNQGFGHEPHLRNGSDIFSIARMHPTLGWGLRE